MRHRTVSIGLGLFCGLAFASQTSGRPDAGRPATRLTGSDTVVLSVDLSLRDWDLSDITEARFGLIGVFREPGGDRPVVYRLDRAAVPTFPELYSGGVPDFDGDVFIVSDFRAANRNRLDGFFNPFAASPSEASASLDAAPEGRRGLRLRFSRAEDGFCGVWIHLFDYRLPPARRRYLDGTAFGSLSFWIRGARGGEKLALKIADADWERREDALPLGDVGEFLPSGRVEPRWQQAVVPLDRLPARIDPAKLASVILEGTSPGDHEVYLSRLAFAVSQDRGPPLPEPEPDNASSKALSTAIWVWNTSRLLADPTERQAAIDFLVRERFDRVFLQLPGLPGETGVVGDSEWDETSVRPLVSALRSRGMRVYALDGHRSYALPSLRDRVLRTVDDVVRYNRESPPEARFQGLHHDIEPYLLAGFQGGRRDEILVAYLDLVAEAARRLRGAGLAYDVDIPFWYDAPDELTYRPMSVEYEGAVKPVSQHVIDLVDEITIMDYRTLAYGADGTIRHAQGELEYAAERGKQVLLGLETGALPDEDLYYLFGSPVTGLPDAPPAGAIAVLAQRGDSASLHLLPEGVDETEPGDLASRLGLGPEDSDRVVWWPVSRRVHVPASKITFAELGVERLREVMEATAHALGRYPSFAGFAIHYLSSYKAFLEP